MTDRVPFTPDWVSPPGDTIADVLDERGWTRVELAQRLGVTPKHVSELLSGKASLSPEVAEGLSRVLGSTPTFWLTREARYRAGLARLAEHDALVADAPWLDELPLAWMARQGWFSRPSLPEALGARVGEALRFFQVASVDAWRTTWMEPLAAWRASKRFEKRPGAVAAWLCQAERLAADLPCGPFDKAAFKTLLPELRALTREREPAVFLRELQRRCAEVGVALVWVPAPPGCPISGATRWLAPDKALLALSVRYRADDHLWFSFFHEVGHILLHGKKILFIEGIDGLREDDEEEANAFARDQLIPPAHASRLSGLRTETAVRAFAAEIGVSPGVVVGRLQHDKILPFSALNELKVRYTWAGDSEDG